MKNVCVVGYGAIGKTHIEALKNVDNAILYAVCDIKAERAEQCGKKYQVLQYTDFDEMLLDKNIDAIHICTPHHLHYEMMEKALKAGKSIVCEKPVTRCEEEFEKLLKLKDSDKICVVFQNRCNPCIVKMKEVIDSGELGNVKMAKGILTWHRGMDYYNQDAWRGKWATEGGGVLINQAIHTFDYFDYLVGEIKSVKAKMANFSLGELEVEDSVMAHLLFENDVPGVFFATNAYGMTSSPLFEVVLEKGKLCYTDKKLYLDGTLIEEDSKVVSGKDYWGNSHVKIFKNFYEKDEFFSPQDVKGTMRMVFEMYKSSRNVKEFE